MHHSYYLLSARECAVYNVTETIPLLKLTGLDGGGGWVQYTAVVQYRMTYNFVDDIQFGGIILFTPALPRPPTITTPTTSALPPLTAVEAGSNIHAVCMYYHRSFRRLVMPGVPRFITRVPPIARKMPS